MSPGLLQTRQRLEQEIEELIAILDLLDGDENLEPYLASFDPRHMDDVEDENEHGGEIVDEPHDELDQGDNEPTLGWPERYGQGARIGVDCGPGDFVYDPNDGDGLDVWGRSLGLIFEGDGCSIGRNLIREKVKERKLRFKSLRKGEERGWSRKTRGF